MVLKRVWVIGVALAVLLGGLGMVAAQAAQQEEGTAWLGVSLRDGQNGPTVTAVVPGSPADDAGLRVGDVITAVDGKEVKSADDLVTAIQSYKPGDEVTLTVVWRSESRDVKVTLGTRSEEPSTPNQPGRRHQVAAGVLDLLGMTANVTDQGIQVKKIEADSPLAQTGLQEGDLITAVNGTSTADLNARTLLELLSGGKLTLTVSRNGEEQEIEVEIPDNWVGHGVKPNVQVVQQPTQLGVGFTTLTPDVAQEKGLSVEEGALIDEVIPDSPAAKAELQVGDIVTAVDGDQVDQEHTLRDRLFAYEEGDVVRLTVLRGTDTLEVEATLGPNPYMMGPEGGRFGFGGMVPFSFTNPGSENGHPFMMPNGGMPGQQGPSEGTPAPAQQGSLGT